MQWIDEVPDKYRISRLQHRIQDNHSVLTWVWPEDIQFVYVCRVSPDSLQGSADEAILGQAGGGGEAMKLYTREEYKAKAGYWQRVDGIGRYACRVYPCLRQEQGIAALRQEDDGNLLMFSTGKAKIRYTIKHGWVLFGRMKPVRIELVSEAAVPKEALCYVKKEGGPPLHKDDGTVYPFIQDIAPGRNRLPEVEISRGAQLKIFFTDGKKYGDMYELIPV